MLGHPHCECRYSLGFLYDESIGQDVSTEELRKRVMEQAAKLYTDAQASSALSDELRARSKRRAELVTGLLARSDVLQRPWCVRACMHAGHPSSPDNLFALRHHVANVNSTQLDQL